MIVDIWERSFGILDKSAQNHYIDQRQLKSHRVKRDFSLYFLFSGIFRCAKVDYSP